MRLLPATKRICRNGYIVVHVIKIQTLLLEVFTVYIVSVRFVRFYFFKLNITGILLKYEFLVLSVLHCGTASLPEGNVLGICRHSCSTRAWYFVKHRFPRLSSNKLSCMFLKPIIPLAMFSCLCRHLFCLELRPKCHTHTAYSRSGRIIEL